MPKIKTRYICSNCEYETGKWLGRCPDCNQFNTMEESQVEKNTKTRLIHTSSTKPLYLKDIELSDPDGERVPTKINELDRVLSGGIVQGALVLVGGEPGIGKSTLIMQICQNINQKILYISGEESIKQIKLRANRLGITAENLLLMSETSMEIISEVLNEVKPQLLIIDSIQTMHTDELTSAPGSATQIRECSAKFLNISKGKGISTILIGHVTKDGNIAGPKILEHMVDTVLYFEGEDKASYRIIRAVKNRFGSTNEIGIFKMEEKGLVEITNPSEYMLSGRPLNVSGSAITCTLEGTRPILAEVQALVSHTSFGTPRRTATGTDYNRVVMLMAVLEKRMGLALGSYDSYVNIAGGMRIAEPALDAAVISAIASSYKNAPVDPFCLIFGEVGLSGEIRAVSMANSRISEAKKLGFKKCVMPEASVKEIKGDVAQGIEIVGVAHIGGLLRVVFTKD